MNKMSRVATISKDLWLNEGFELFGDDTYSWLFKCPVCAHVQCFDDFTPYLDIGANPDDAFSTCIGRYQRRKAKKEDLLQGCNYSLKDAINLAPRRIIGPNGVFSAFAFAEPDRQHA